MGTASSRDGGGSSSHPQQHRSGKGHLGIPPSGGPLTTKEYRARLATSGGTQGLVFAQSGLRLRYAFASLRGYYPSTPDKANQDSLCVHTHFGGDPEQAFFGIYDGHGEYGTQCSQFAKDKAGVCLCA